VKGLTIIEVLIAMAILAVLAVVTLTAIPTFLRLNQVATGDQAVTNHARTFMETLRSQWREEAAFAAGELPVVRQPVGYSCSASVSDPDPGAPGIRKRVTLSCTRSGGGNYSFIVELGRPR
jgi:prepilin-type N-terminal cleavage/methylation domain-containing protein